MKNCPYCKREIADGAKFCLYCMEELESKTIIVTKRRVGKKIAPYAFIAAAALTVTAASSAAILKINSRAEHSLPEPDTVSSSAADFAEDEDRMLYRSADVTVSDIAESGSTASDPVDQTDENLSAAPSDETVHASEDTDPAPVSAADTDAAAETAGASDIQSQTGTAETAKDVPPAADKKPAPVTDKETAPVTDEETAPVTDKETSPATDEETAPATDKETSPVTDEETAPVTETGAGQTPGKDTEASQPEFETSGYDPRIVDISTVSDLYKKDHGDGGAPLTDPVYDDGYWRGYRTSDCDAPQIYISADLKKVLIGALPRDEGWSTEDYTGEMFDRASFWLPYCVGVGGGREIAELTAESGKFAEDSDGPSNRLIIRGTAIHSLLEQCGIEDAVYHKAGKDGDTVHMYRSFEISGEKEDLRITFELRRLTKEENDRKYYRCDATILITYV